MFMVSQAAGQAAGLTQLQGPEALDIHTAILSLEDWTILATPESGLLIFKHNRLVSGATAQPACPA